MVPHGADVGVYVRGALVGFCGLTAEGKAWIKDHFSHEAWQTLNGRTVYADWRSAQRMLIHVSFLEELNMWRRLASSTHKTLAVVPNDIGHTEDGPKSEWWRRIGHFSHVTAMIAVLLSVGFFVWGVIAVSRSIKYLGPA